MSSSETFCLRWNEFPNNINESFSHLRGGTEFSDVTLAVEGGEQIKAHRIILSACSPFFKNLFKGGSHPHPFVYMKGISFGNLSSIIDFAYLGEVNVEQRELDTFLEAARELKIKGLATKDEPAQQDPPYTNIPHQLDKIESNVTIDDTDDNEAFDKSLQNEHVPFQNIQMEDSYVETVISEGSELKDFLDNTTDSFVETENRDLTQLANKIEDMIEKVGGLWTCKMCGKSSNMKQRIRQHVEIHIDGFTHPCNTCGKSFRSKNSLRKHKSLYHR